MIHGANTFLPTAIEHFYRPVCSARRALTSKAVTEPLGDDILAILPTGMSEGGLSSVYVCSDRSAMERIPDEVGRP